MNLLKMYSILKMVIFQPAMFDYQRVSSKHLPTNAGQFLRYQNSRVLFTVENSSLEPTKSSILSVKFVGSWGGSSSQPHKKHSLKLTGSLKFTPENRPFNAPKGNDISSLPTSHPFFRGEHVSFREGRIFWSMSRDALKQTFHWELYQSIEESSNWSFNSTAVSSATSLFSGDVESDQGWTVFV